MSIYTLEEGVHVLGERLTFDFTTPNATPVPFTLRQIPLNSAESYVFRVLARDNAGHSKIGISNAGGQNAAGVATLFGVGTIGWNTGWDPALNALAGAYAPSGAAVVLTLTGIATPVRWRVILEVPATAAL
ncbi:MAG TPA: hypothetical protein VK510_03125 [Solirubrobacteraceae bacterium]|nr:hypothetical protein [Solirubrobacteraceae bacterium]